MFTFDRPISIQKINEEEEWETLYNLHASINKASTDNSYLKGGAIQEKRTLTFRVRYFKMLEEISYNPQLYRIVYDNVPFAITDYDDYKLMHKSITLLGVSV